MSAGRVRGAAPQSVPQTRKGAVPQTPRDDRALLEALIKAMPKGQPTLVPAGRFVVFTGSRVTRRSRKRS
jgi:hypothetical protein